MLERLKIQANFVISPTEIIRVQRLLQEQPTLLLSPEGRANLKLLLAPLLCRNETQQQQFYEIYETYLTKDLKLSPQEIKEQTAFSELETAKEVPQGWLKKWLPLWASLIFGLLAIGLLIYGWMNPPIHDISFEKHQTEVRVGETLSIKNSTDTTKLGYHFHWHCMDMEGKDTMHQHQDHDLTWLVLDPKGDFTKKIYLHAHHPETTEAIGMDSMEITILCNTLKVGSISVTDSTLSPDQPLPFSVEVANTENLQYQWQFGDGNFSEEIAPIHTYAIAGTYPVQVVVKDTVNAAGKCEKIVQTSITIAPDTPDDPIILEPFQLLEEPPNITYPLKWWYSPLLLFLLSAAAYCWWKWWHRPDPNELAIKAQDIALKNRFAAPDKNPYSIPFAPAASKIQADQSQFEIAQSLRNRQQGNRQILDIPATLNATIEQGGFPTVQYKYTSRPTDYLVLIDLQSVESHLARLFQYLAGMLQDQDVLLDIFYYQKDFQHCWNARQTKGVNLQQLYRLYPQQRLIIMGDAHALVEQTAADELLHPIWERQLRKWTDRILLTPLPIVSWTFLEARLYRLFALFPADLLGIMQAVRFMEAGAVEEDLPTTLKEWENQLQKSQIEEDTVRRWRTLAQHKAYLANHPDVLRWLKALVVYPSPTWNVTIAIGKALGVPVTYDNLMLLARVPWLQNGDFKLRLWRTFWTDLPKADEKIARQAVKEELEAVRQQTNNAFAGQSLEQNLAIQDFALVPNNAENQAIIQYLENAGLLPKLHLEELDKVVERHIPEYRVGEKTGQTLQYYLKDAETEKTKDLTRPVPTRHFWWGLAVSFLSLLMIAGLLVKGNIWYRQYAEIEKNENAVLYNQIVKNYYEKISNTELENQYGIWLSKAQVNANTSNFQELISNFPFSGFRQKIEFNAFAFYKISLLDKKYEITQNNLQKLIYNEGVYTYEKYLNDIAQIDSLQSAKKYFKRAINYDELKIDSVSHAAMHALATVHHILGETDSVCLLLDTLLKIPNIPFFDAIPNLDSKAVYCQNTIPTPAILPYVDTLLKRIKAQNIEGICRKIANVNYNLSLRSSRLSQTQLNRINHNVSNPANTNLITRIPLNATVELLDSFGNFYAVQYKNQIGWVIKTNNNNNTLASCLEGSSTKKPLPTSNEKITENTEIKIEGMVLDYLSKKPLSEVSVELKNSANTKVAIQLTAENGTFSFVIDSSLINIKSLLISFKKEGFLTISLEKLFADGENLPIKTYLELDDDNDIPNTFTDPRDKQTYKTITIGTQTWFAKNLNYQTTDSWCYLELDEFCQKAGRLYTWEAAKSACPYGWHLPTDEEWKTLLNSTGGYYDGGINKDVGDPRKSYQVLVKGGPNNFSTLLSGERDNNGEFASLSKFGGYWSATEGSEDYSWYYDFNGKNSRVGRYNGNKLSSFSCRCIKD